MQSFKKWLENNLFDDDFDKETWLAKIKARGKVISSKQIIENSVLTVYHGFNLDPKNFNYIFDSSKSEQGLLWFTHKYIRGYNPIEYVRNRGNYILTYQLNVKLIKDVIKYENGEISERPPENIEIDSTENSKYLKTWSYIIELPENWFFTYKTEKFIGFSGKLVANSSMISSSEQND